ncbi:uncharacterized protein [Drosophila pseudoobscura]|uniref:Uncharacterized protein n=1 Tax=Drosophila pseudoobscura pseudoobscura TaxID=46245 RepID=A0A6I8UMU8_DROPS|nr:uncharacterized protein LOC4800868 [Drosophila pseudoobscura]
MGRQQPVAYQVIILLIFVSYSEEVQYEFVSDNEDVMSDCQDKPKGALGFDSLFDMSELTLNMSDDGVQIQGNVTSIWDVKPTDRIQGSFSVLYFDRGSWQPTILNIVTKEFCDVMYDERQFWYKFWTKHVINSKDVKDKCLNVPGTKLVMETFLTTAVFGFDVPLKEGRHKFKMDFRAFDENNVQRENSICFEMTGEFYKI